MHKPLAYHAGARHSFPCGTMQHRTHHTQMANKGHTEVCIKSGTSKWRFHEPQKPWQDDQFTSQSPTQMVAHGKLTSFHQITEVNSCVEVLGKTSHTYHLSPPSNDSGTKTGKLWMAIAAGNVLNFPQRRWDHIRESSNTRSVNYKVCWTYGNFRL